jgi:hypothetical protein
MGKETAASTPALATDLRSLAGLRTMPARMCPGEM